MMRIFDFGIVADWDSRLKSLSDMAEPETWTYRTIPDKSPVPVLNSYVRFTFERLYEQGKVAICEKTACFNTGLLTPGQEEIFGVFTESEKFNPDRPEGSDNKRWFLKSWSRSGDRSLSPFDALPGLATYWEDPAELTFNPHLEVRLNTDHIIRENLNRFPVELGGQVDSDGRPLDLTASPELEDEDEAIPEMLEDKAGPSAQSLKARIVLDGAMAHSIRLAKRSYRVAIPQFHHGAIQLLVPLYLRDTSRADLALTIERFDTYYRAATVLYPDWAYRKARLLSRPNSEWLGGFRNDL